jgi:hypothetical protein
LQDLPILRELVGASNVSHDMVESSGLWGSPGGISFDHDKGWIGKQG